jgi:cell shape-determining protein MreC
MRGLAPKKRGRKNKNELEKELNNLRRENADLQERLEQAEAIIDVQKKLSRLLGLATEENGKGKGA